MGWHKTGGVHKKYVRIFNFTLYLYYLCTYYFNTNIMAMEIKSPPVLKGKAAREFHKRWAEAKDDTSKEEAQASYRKWKAYFEKQERLHPSSPW
jgi:hypothetical protein